MAMAMSINGMICLPDGSEPFLSVAGGRLNAQIIRDTGSLIWGRRTYENVLQRYNGTDEMELSSLIQDIPKVVVSRDPDYRVVEGYTHATSPKEAIDLLASQGLQAVAVVGGSQLNAAFLEAGLVDEIIVDIEPAIIGHGVPLLAQTELQVKTSLVSVDRVNDGELLVRYKIIK